MYDYNWPSSGMRCGEVKYVDSLKVGLSRLKEYEENIVPQTFAYNPHELTRFLELFDILTVSQIIIEASLARKISMKPLSLIKGAIEPRHPLMNKVHWVEKSLLVKNDND